MLRRISILLALVSAQAFAQKGGRQVFITPQIGAEMTATTGSEVFERHAGTVSVSPRVLVTAGTEAKGLIKYKISAGDKLIVISPTEACSPDLCLQDKNRDGRFELRRIRGAAFSGKIETPIPYEPTDALVEQADDNSFRQSLIFLGVNGKTLRLAYREFSNDMARPAFSNEVTFELTGTFPETIAYRDVVIDVLGVGNTGLRYRIKKVGSGA